MKLKRVLMIGAIALLLVGSGIGTYFIVENVKSRHQYNEFLKLYYQHYDDRLALFEEENKALKDVDVVFLGDSLTEGYDLKTYYPEYTVVNRGIGGDTTFGLEKRLELSAYDVNPRMVMMLIGANNFDTMLNNYENIVISLKDHLPNSDITLLSLTSMTKEWGRNNEKAKKNNIKIKEYADKYNLRYLDLYNPLLDPETNQLRLEYTTDGGHFTPAGYEVITSLIKPIIANYLAD